MLYTPNKKMIGTIYMARQHIKWNVEFVWKPTLPLSDRVSVKAQLEGFIINV